MFFLPGMINNLVNGFMKLAFISGIFLHIPNKIMNSLYCCIIETYCSYVIYISEVTFILKRIKIRINV